MAKNENGGIDKEQLEQLEKEAERKIFKFSGKVYVDRLNSLLEDNKYLVFYTLLLFGIIVLLVIGYFRMADKITIRVDIPPKIYRTGTIYVGSETANKTFFRIWGDYIVDQLGNFGPYSIRKHVDNVLYMFDPDKVLKYQTQFQELAEYAKSNLVTHEFTPEIVSVDDSGDYEAKGVAKNIVGDNISTTYEYCRYRLKFDIRDYHLFVEDVGIECKPIRKSLYDEKITKLKRKKRKEFVEDIKSAEELIKQEKKDIEDAVESAKSGDVNAEGGSDGKM